MRIPGAAIYVVDDQPDYNAASLACRVTLASADLLVSLLNCYHCQTNRTVREMLRCKASSMG